MKTLYLFSLHTLLFSILLHFSNVVIPPIFSSAEREIEISIKATGNKSPGGIGSEVWLYSMQRSGGIDIPYEEIQLTPGWDRRGSHSISYYSQPNIASWKGKISAPLYIYFGSHPFSGEVEISTNDGRVWTEQLYSEVQLPFKKIMIAPGFSFLDRFISSIVFSLIASSMLMLLGRKREGQQSWERGVYILGFVSVILAGAIYAYSMARFFNGLPFNGALQFWNPLRRLAVGDLPGRDFFSFHGIGQALAFFPLFKIFGGDFLASEFLRQFGTYILFVVSGFYFLKTLGLPRSLALATTIISISFSLFYQLAIPLESSLGLRTSLPLLLATLTFNLSKKYPLYQLLFFALLGSLVMLWSTEQGPVALLGIFIWILVENEGGIFKGFIRAFYALFISLVLYLSFLFITSMGHPIEIIKYSFLDIASDQRWFFGAPPNPFIASLSQFFSAPMGYSLIYLLIGFILTFLCLFFKRLKHQGQGLILFVLVSNAIASFLMQTGYTSVLYNACAERAIYLVACVYIYQLSPNFFKKVTYYPAYLIIMLAPIYMSQQIFNLKEKAIATKDHNYYPQLRASLGRHYKDLDKVVELVKTTNDTSLHSDYRGFIEELVNSKPTTRFDYIIHALGKEKRVEYLNLFNSPPNYIQIQKPSHIIYAKWLQQETWLYYEKILELYEPSSETSTSTIWKRSSRPNKYSYAEPIVIKDIGSEIDLGKIIREKYNALEETSYWKVEVKYHLGENYIGKSLTRNIVSYKQGHDGNPIPISLPPYESEFSFPLRFSGEELVLNFDSFGLFSDDKDLVIKEIAVRPLPFPRKSLDVMFEK